ncbi:MAG: alpha/beta hydrolase [Treponema sp.]|jgi:pimeloyl-ACP methyl ester carboxylesterase|nr:alpha/beta hydrolase [Treponema sp.]
MNEHIHFFQDDGHPMRPWPPLAEKSRVLKLRHGGTLFYYDSGAISAGDGQPRTLCGKPSVVLVHGLGDEADSWRRLFGPLSAAGFRVIAPDLPGFGRSAVRGRISIGRHAAAVLELMEASGAADRDNPAVLAGSSMGALAAEAAAFRRPDWVRALILMDGCLPLSGGVNKNLVLMGLPFIGKKWYRSFRQNHERARRSLFPYYHDFEALPEEDRQFLRERVIARVESPDQERAYFASLRSLNLTGLFRKARFARGLTRTPAKILLLWGAEDQVLPPEAGTAIRSLRPDAAHVEISGAGHLPHQEKPGETAAAILNFLQQLPQAGPPDLQRPGEPL